MNQERKSIYSQVTEAQLWKQIHFKSMEEYIENLLAKGHSMGRLDELNMELKAEIDRLKAETAALRAQLEASENAATYVEMAEEIDRLKRQVEELKVKASDDVSHQKMHKIEMLESIAKMAEGLGIKSLHGQLTAEREKTAALTAQLESKNYELKTALENLQKCKESERELVAQVAELEALLPTVDIDDLGAPYFLEGHPDRFMANLEAIYAYQQRKQAGNAKKQDTAGN